MYLGGLREMIVVKLKKTLVFNTNFEILPIDPSGRTWHLTSYSNLKRGYGMYYSTYFE